MGRNAHTLQRAKRECIFVSLMACFTASNITNILLHLHFCNQLLLCMALFSYHHGSFRHEDLVPTPLQEKLKHNSSDVNLFLIFKIKLKFEHIFKF